MTSSRFSSCRANGLDHPSKIKKFETYKGWRDPDLTQKQRRRSIPNPIKRFLYDLKGDLPQFEKSQRAMPPRRLEELNSRSDANLSSSSDFIPKIVQVEPFNQTHQKKKRTVDLCRPAGGVVRCAECDYPYDSTKRIRPPHLFSPTVVEMPVNSKARSFAVTKSELSGYLSFAGQAKRKITRLKRKRSSTELYAGLVVVSPV